MPVSILQTRYRSPLDARFSPDDRWVVTVTRDNATLVRPARREDLLATAACKLSGTGCAPEQ
ncbi:MAG TPA: hypothetical protein VFS21_37845 [Roseiflexaceae bacterium]|nr:hypothetical protein [Roseiflexaceae bacterium]